MVFALPPNGAPSGVTVMEVLREELERHVEQSHVDLPGERTRHEDMGFGTHKKLEAKR